MDLQAEKLQLIKWLAGVTDTAIIKEIKSLKNTSSKNLFSQYTKQDLIDRAKSSMEDIKAGRTTPLSEFKKEIKVWKQSKNIKLK